MGNTFGRLFCITTWGESHGGGVGVVVDGCPPLIPITAEEIQADLDKRRPGQSGIVSQRKESDTVHILSGIFDGKTLGTPISMLVYNEDVRPEHYEDVRTKFRPSHADYTYEAKYGVRDWRGGGRSSARETVGRVAAGAIARKYLAMQYGVEVLAWVSKVGKLTAECDVSTVTRAQIEATPVRCPDLQVAQEMINEIENIRKEGNSLGGAITCAIRGCPSGWGDPVFDKIEADLAKAVMSLPATKGFEIGSGFAGTDMTGLEHNDEFYTDEDGRIRTKTNYSGGVQGGITNGETIYFRVAFKPTATVMREQATVSSKGEGTSIRGRGRHDPCVLPRAVVMVEAMALLVMADHALRQRAIRGT